MTNKIVIRIDPDLADLIPGFLKNRANDIDKLRALNAIESYDEIRLIGHSMKGAGGGYGFDEITELGGRIEVAALAQDSVIIEDTLELLADYLRRVEPKYDE